MIQRITRGVGIIGGRIGLHRVQGMCYASGGAADCLKLRGGLLFLFVQQPLRFIAHLLGHGFAKWQLPERYEVIDGVPRTSTGKFWKLKLRERFPR